jgi:hypothetical protein
MTKTATAPKNDEPEVFARTPAAQLDENGVMIRCDSSDDQPAPYLAVKQNTDGSELKIYLCGHHARKQGPALEAKGWIITPEHYASYGIEVSDKA